MRARSGDLYRRWAAAGPYAGPLVTARLLDSIPVREDEFFAYADGVLQTVAPSWTRGGSTTVGADFLVSSGKIVPSGAGSYSYSPAVQLDGSKPLMLTAYDVRLGVGYFGDSFLTLHAACSSINGSGTFYAHCRAITAGATIALHTTSGVSTVTLSGALSASSVYTIGKIQLVGMADGSAQLYVNGSRVAQRSGNVRTSGNKYIAIAHGSNASDSASPRFSIERITFAGYAP